MSCIAGVFLPAGQVPDPALVRQMLAAMHQRAPHGDRVNSQGPVALGTALLRTGSSRAEGASTATLDGRTWIAADARIDGRAELIGALRHAGATVEDDTPHASLILHAYAVFGDAFLDHLIGDFAFALWDSQRARLVCARDHLGVRPFYYAWVGDSLFFASDVCALLCVPGLSRVIDHASAGEFLLFGTCQEPARTIYRDIRCLSPSTRLDVMAGRAIPHRYWEPPNFATRQLRAPAEYVEQFTSILQRAVEDRLPTGPVALQLSGGLDSTAIAAAVVDSPLDRSLVTAHHLTRRAVVPEDDEFEFARLAADHLRIPLVCHDLAAHELFAGCDDPRLDTAMPMPSPHLQTHAEILQRISAEGAQVVVSGYLGDAVLAAPVDYYAGLLRGAKPLAFVKALGHTVRHTRSLRGLGLRSLLNRPPARPAWRPPFPDWIDTGFAQTHRLREVWEGSWERHQNAVDATRQLRLPWIHRQFEAAESLPAPVVARYPFCDVRLIEFLLQVPPFLLADKAILRESLRGRLPEAIRSRSKTAAAGDLVRAMVTAGKMNPACAMRECKGLRPVVQARLAAGLDRFKSGAGADSTWSTWLIVQAIAFSIWFSKQGEVTE